MCNMAAFAIVNKVKGLGFYTKRHLITAQHRFTRLQAIQVRMTHGAAYGARCDLRHVSAVAPAPAASLATRRLCGRT